MAFFKKKSVIAILVILALLVGFLIYRGATKKPVYTTVAAERGTVVQEVSATGRVKAADSVDLAFEKGGKVGAVYVKVGSRVVSGQKLAALSNNDLAADLAKAEANLAAEEAALAEMESGTRPEEIAVAETDLENAKMTAMADLKQDYDAAAAAVAESAIKGKNALLTLTDLQFKYFIGGDADSLAIAEAKKAAVASLFDVSDGGLLSTEQVSELSGGAYAKAQAALLVSDYSKIDSALLDTVFALQKVKAALDTVKISTNFTSTEKTNLSSEKNTIGTEITTLSGKQQAIAVQKITNETTIAAKEAALTLKKAGSTSEELAVERAKIASVQASVDSALAALQKTIITSPIAGVVTKQDAKVGEIIAANTALISIISDKQFEIEANIPEVDFAKIKKGDTASVTLDAYGNEVLFSAKIVKIDPAETIIDGVPTYKTTFQFTAEDGRIKSGMTANLDIETARHEGVLVVPARAIFTKDGEKTVRILSGEIVTEMVVKTGLRSPDGGTEVLEGVREGDMIITDIK